MTKPVQIQRYSLRKMPDFFSGQATDAGAGDWVKYEDHQADLLQIRSLLEAKAKEWQKESLDSVPPEWTSREMHIKYLKDDNYAAGMNDCASELLSLAATLGNQGK